MASVSDTNQREPGAGRADGAATIGTTRTSTQRDDSFTLFDLRVDVIATERPMVCNHVAGSWFTLIGENLCFPDGQTFPLYPLAALLPLLPAKQRPTHPNDWMSTDAEIACPDPHCGGRFRITRTGVSTFHHGDVTLVPLPNNPSSS
jgi:uncharacterized repeat protein (TIGR04076 family)